MALKLIRGLDGISYALIAQVLILLFPGFGRDVLGAPHLLTVTPAAALAWFVWRLPPTHPDRPLWGAHVARLRGFCLAHAALLPFVIWLWTAPESWYLFWNAVLALVAGVGVFFNLALVLRELAELANQQEMALEARMVRMLVIYVLLVPLSVALIGVLFLQATRDLAPGLAVAELLGLLRRYWPAMAFLLFLPICLCITLCIRVRLALTGALRNGEVQP